MGTLNEDLTAIKAVEDKLTANQVAKFSYTQHAYDNPLTEADGVTAFNPENPQNIPLGRADILKVNPSVLQYGWRAQASAITRMLMNHFLGRVSYNLNKLNDNVSSMLATFLSHLGTANGIATLDADGRIPYSQLPESAMELKGYWDADTNTPTLADGTGTSGDFYFVDVAGTRDLGSGEQYFAVGDRVLYDGAIWKNISSGNIKTINNRAPTATGNIDLTKSDVGLSNVDNTADSNMPVENGTTKFTTGGAHNMLTSLAPAFDATVSYSQGTIVSYQGRLYRCTTAHQGAWSDNDFAIANLNEGVGTSNVTGVKGEAESSYRSGNVNISMTDLIKNFKIIAGVPFLNYLGRKWKVIEQTDLNVSLAKFYNGLWLCPSSEDALYVSEDAENWVKVADEALTPIAYAKGLYFAYGSNKIWWSDNGRTWIEGETIGESITASHTPEVENKLFLYHEKLDIFEICTDNGVFYSEDGKTWQQGSFAGATLPIAFRTQSIVASDTIMVVTTGSGSQHQVWWSEDGIVWTSVNFNIGWTERNRVYYGNGEFFWSGASTGLKKSADGKTWSTISTSSGESNSWDKASHYLFYNEASGEWIDIVVTFGTAYLSVSWYVKGRQWSALGQALEASSFPTISTLSQLINYGNLVTVQPTQLLSFSFIGNNRAIVTTNVGIFTLERSLVSGVVSTGTTIQYSSSGANYIPRWSNIYRCDLLDIIVKSFGNGTQGTRKPTKVTVIEDIMILYPISPWDGRQLPLNTYPDEIFIINTATYAYCKVKLTNYDYIEQRLWFKYGGGTLLTAVLKDQVNKTYISNFDTCIEWVKEQFVYTKKDIFLS